MPFCKEVQGSSIAIYLYRNRRPSRRQDLKYQKLSTNPIQHAIHNLPMYKVIIGWRSTELHEK